MNNVCKPSVLRRTLIILLAAAHLNLTGCFSLESAAFNPEENYSDGFRMNSVTLETGETIIFNTSKGMLKVIPAHLKGKSKEGREFVLYMQLLKEMIRAYPQGKPFSPEEISLAKEIHLSNGLALRCNEGGFRYDEKTKKVSCITTEGKLYTVNPDSIKLLYRSLPAVIPADTLKYNTIYYPEALLLKNNILIQTDKEGVIYLAPVKKVIGVTENNKPEEIDAYQIKSYTIYEFDFLQTAAYLLGGVLFLAALYFVLMLLFFKSLFTQMNKSGK